MSFAQMMSNNLAEARLTGYLEQVISEEWNLRRGTQASSW